MKSGLKNLPRDLGIKIGSKEEALWIKVKKEAEIMIEQSQDNLIIQKEILILAEKRIAEEKEAFK